MHSHILYPIKASNRLLAALSPVEWERWQGKFEMVNLKLDQVINETGAKINHIYFPVNCIISLQYDFQDGTSAEFGQIGNEGLCGVAVFMGTQSTNSKAVVIGSGSAYRIKADFMLEEFNHSSSVRRLVLRYMQAMMSYASQTAVCNRRHSIDQQLCKTILQNLDRIPGNELTFTHELIAKTLGVRREGISHAAKKLQNEGLIKYTRGHISILNRDKLSHHACECYDIVKQEYEKLIPSRLLSRLINEDHSSQLSTYFK